ncbi:MAG: XRE family transcriptional regulator [Candidatus Aenigmatarchaeota archaeon]|nr:MAG: XRE family transcriptional regulator [Candidatus Aenigmarchaeota archaeon]
MKKIEVPKIDFINFLIRAKINTWAGEGKKIRKSDYSRNYYYKEGSFEYMDQYFGNLMDGGREVVFFDGKPVWIMCYHGGVLRDYNDQSAEIFSFLRKALQSPPKEFPVRGPTSYTNDKFTYKNSWKGDLYYFWGDELILRNDNGLKVYRRAYVGGEIRDKEYFVLFI